MLIMLLLLGIIDFWLIGVKTADYQPDNELKTFIENLNKMRRDVANRFGIGNMHELKYDQSLVPIAQSSTQKDLDEVDRTNRYFGFWTYEGAENDLKGFTNDFKINWTQSYRDQVIEKWQAESIREWEHMNPLQRRIGCAPNTNTPRSFEIICVIGPEAYLSDWNTREVIPGSECLPGYENQDGLCVGTDDVIITINPDSPSSAQADFISKLNDARKTYAVENSIKEMQELVYDKTLVDIAKFLTPENKDVTSVKWRYTMFKTYDGGVEELMEATRQWDKEEKEKKIKDFTDGIKTYFKPYEHIFPRQNKIGCVMKQGLPDGNKVVCLLGPEGKIDPMKIVIKSTTATTVAPPPPPKVTEPPVQPFPEDPQGPEPTTTEEESELARRIAEWKAKEIDGDEYDEDFPTTTEESSAFSFSIFSVFMIVWVI